MASNKQQTSINQQTGQFQLNQLNTINQLNTTANQLTNTINSTLNTTINEIVNNKKKIKNLVKKDAIKQSQQFNYQNLNVNLNPKEKIVQDQSIKLNKSTDGLLGNQFQFKIVQPNEDDNVGLPSLKFKISTTRKSGNSELRKLRIPNQNLNNSINLSNSNLQNNSSTIIPNPNDLPAIKNLSITNNLNSSTTTANNLPSTVVNQTNLINRIPNIQISNKLASIQTKHQIVNKPTDEHEQNCRCYLHSEKTKKELTPNKQKSYSNNDNRKKNNKSRLSSSSSTSNSSSSASSRSSSCSKKSGGCLSGHSTKLSSRSSSSSSDSNSSSSNSSKSSDSSNSSNSSNCSSTSSSNCSSRSSSTDSRSGSCIDCASHKSSRSTSTSSSGSSSSDESSNSSVKQDNDSKLNRSRSRQKESNFKLNENDLRNKEQSTKLGDLTTQQLLNNVNETLIKHQKQKLNLNQFNLSSPNDLPSPINSLNNNLNSQPSSVSCESNCYSPSVSINSPSCSTLRKQDPLERQKLRSYRLPHLTAQQQKQQQLLQQQQSKKDKESEKNEILNEQNKELSNQNQDIGSNEKINSQPESQTKKLKKQKLKGEKKKEKTKKVNLKKKNQLDKLANENNNLELKQKAKKKTKKIKQTTEEDKLKKKKGKKKLKSNKLISDSTLIENLEMSQLLNKSDLKDINNSKNSELDKMRLLMNANLNSGIPPNIDTEVILDSLSSLIKEDKNLLIKNQFLINQNTNANKLIKNNNNQESNKLNLTNNESQSTSNKNDKSPDSGIQSQSESPNQLANQLANQKNSQSNNVNEKSKKIRKSTKNDLTSKNSSILDQNSKVLPSASSMKTDNLQNKQLINNNNQIKNISTTTESNQQQKDSILFNQYMDSSIQSLIENLQKTSANLNLSNLNQLPTLNPIINSNLNPIKPKSIPSDLIALTEFLLNMNNKNKDTNLPSTSSSTNSANLNFPLTNDETLLNKKNSQLPSASTSNRQKKATKSNESDLLKNIKLTKLNKDDYSFKKITDQQQSINSQPAIIKNTDLWRNNESMNVNSPLNIEELNKRLRSTKAELTNSSNKKINEKQSNKSTRKSVSKKSSKQKSIKTDEQDYLLNIQSKELNKHLKKNSLSDILCTNELDLETNSNQQSRSVSSLSQNHYTSKDKSNSKKKKKSSSSSKHKAKKDGFIIEPSEELNKLYLSLIDDFIRLEIMKGVSANKLTKNVGAFKCIKYGKNNKKSKQKQQNQIQFNNNLLISKLMQTNSDSIEKLEKQDKTKKRKKNSSFSQQQQLEESNLIKLNEDSQNNDNTNEHSLPLKKRHHRHTENKCDSDLIDSSNSSSTTELLKINLRTKSTKSTNKKIKSTSVDSNTSEIMNTANQQTDQLEHTNLLNTTTELLSNNNKSTVSQINSCASEQNNVTWVNSNNKQQTNNNEHPHTATSSTSCSSFSNTPIENNKQQNSSTNKIRSVNVNNKLDFDSILIDYDLKELNDFNDLNMVITKKKPRKLRSNNQLPDKIEKMGNVKSKFSNNNKEQLVLINDNLNNKNERLKDMKSVNENNNILQNGKQDRKNKKLKTKIDNNHTMNSDNLVNNQLKTKTSLTTIKKRRKQNKTGFDKPKKKKKPIPKLVDKLEEKELIENKLLIVDDHNLIEDSLDKMDDQIDDKMDDKMNDKMNDKKKKSELNSKKKQNHLQNNKKLTKLTTKIDLNSTNIDSDSTITDDHDLIVTKKMKSTKKQNKNKQLKRKLSDPIDKTKIKKVKLEQDELKIKENSNNEKHETIEKLRNKNRTNLLNKATKKLIKKSTNLINKSAAANKTVNKKQKLNKSTSRIKSVSLKSIENSLEEDAKIETSTTANQDDDFEEIVLKINSVISTTLIKKPKKDKIKIKGPTKKYYKAGLFSDTFKIDPPLDAPSTTNTSASNTPIHQCETPILSVDGETIQSDNDESLLIQDSNSNSDDLNVDQEEGKLRFEDKDAQYNGKERVYTDNEFSTLLPPPCYVYNKERRKLNDFVLPYDIWWQHVNNQLTHTVNPAKTYKRIKGNVFFDVKPTSNFEELSCNCVKPKDPNQLGCGDDCLNRAMWVECNPNLCPCGDQCSNQKLLKNEWAPGLERFLTRNRGFGVRTTQLIKKSTFIIEYIGEIVSEKVFKQRMAETYSADSHHYCLNITSGILIDGYRMANEGRFVNHSCEPNCEMQKWSVNGYYRVGLFALRDIQPNEEVTYDYNFYNFNLEHQQVCHCGSAKCRGVIGGKTKRDNLQLKQDTTTNLTSMEKLIIVKSILKKSDNKRKDCYLSKVENSGTFENSMLNLDKKKLLELIKSFSYTTTKYIRKHNLFLIRNYEKFRQQHNKNVEKKRKLKNAATKDEIYYTASKNNTKQGTFNPLYLTSNSNRPVRTRGFAKVQDNEEFLKLYKLCNLFKEVCQCFIDGVKEKLIKNSNDKQLEIVFNYLKEKSKRRKNENQEIDLSSLELNILSCQYKTVESFKLEIDRLFKNATKHFKEEKDDNLIENLKNLEEYFYKILNDKLIEFNNLINIDNKDDNKNNEKLDDSFEAKLDKNEINLSSNLRISLAAITQTTKETFKILHDTKQINQFNLDYLDNLPISKNDKQQSTDNEVQELQPLYNENELPKFKDKESIDNEEIIRCICTLNKDDGTMVQCDGPNCNVWQHAHCMQADVNEETYLCEKCNPREIDREIKLEKPPIDGVENWTYYFTFTIGDNIIKIGDTVYLERENKRDKTKAKKETQQKKDLVTFTDFDGKKISKTDVDIFRIEHLYKTSDGKKFVYGHHCLRPSETFHEPTRRFFSNEVLSSPLSGSAPLESIKGICYVLDLSTYCKGRPIGSREEDIYICEFKVCKKARSFSKISSGKNNFGINTKPYCFNYFEERLHPKRTFSPHNISIIKKDNKQTVKQLLDKPKLSDKEQQKNQAPKIEQINLTEADIDNINKLHLRTYVQKQFNINKIIEKITKLNEENQEEDNQIEKMETDNNSIKKE